VKLNYWLAKQGITWRFNLSRAPWWEGHFFERLIGVVKQSLNKSIGNGKLRRHKMEEVTLDNNTQTDRLLDYVEDDVQIPVPALCCSCNPISCQVENKVLLILLRMLARGNVPILAEV